MQDLINSHHVVPDYADTGPHLGYVLQVHRMIDPNLGCEVTVHSLNNGVR
jgi:hypothetical protein